MTDELVLAGLHPDIAFLDYLAMIDRLSTSTLSAMRRSPAYCHYRATHPQDAKHFRVGTAGHSAILTPNQFDADFCTVETCNATKASGDLCTHPGVVLTKDGPKCGVHAKKFKALETEKIVLATDEYDLCMRMRDAVFAHAGAMDIINSAPAREVTCLWENGILKKARFDAYGDNLIVELKTDRDATPRGFARSVFQNGYHLAQHHYREGALMVTGEAHDYAWVVVDKTEPHEVAIYEPTPSFKAYSEDEYTKLVADYRTCAEVGEWPGHGDEPMLIDAPRWSDYTEPEEAPDDDFYID